NRTQQCFFRPPKQCDVATGRGTAQRGQQRNKQHLGQIVLCLVLPRIDQRQKAFCKAVQNSPLSNQETLSESNFPSKAIAWPIEHAIPLPCGGGSGRGVSRTRRSSRSRSATATTDSIKQPHCSQTRLRDLAAHTREFLPERPALGTQRAQGMPGARCARSRAWCVGSTRVSHHGHTGITRHSPRNGLRLISRPPRFRGYRIHTSLRLRVVPNLIRRK